MSQYEIICKVDSPDSGIFQCYKSKGRYRAIAIRLGSENDRLRFVRALEKAGVRYGRT